MSMHRPARTAFAERMPCARWTPRSFAARLRCSVALLVAAIAACGGGDAEPTDAQLAETTISQGLRASSPWIRAETVRLVSAASLSEFAPQLESALADPSPLVQTAAVEALLRLGDASAQETALAGLLSGSAEQRIELLNLIVVSTRGSYRREAIERSVRDVDATVRAAALDHLRDIGGTLSSNELQRMTEDDDAGLADRAFRELARLDRDAALDLTLRGMRSNALRERMRAMHFARHLAVPELWPAMRSYVAVGDETEQSMAMLVLGHLGDPSAEEALRQQVLGGQGSDAARALLALAHLPTESARRQAIVHRNDPRRAVRMAALEAMAFLGFPASEFEPFLSDDDDGVGRAAFLHLQEVDPHFAAEAFARVLGETDDPENVLRSLYRANERSEVQSLLEAARARLLYLSAQPDPTVANLATRLLLRVSDPQAVEAAVTTQGSADARYALLEAAAAANDPAYSAWFEEALRADLFALRVIAAIGIRRLGDRYAPPEPEA